MAKIEKTQHTTVNLGKGFLIEDLVSLTTSRSLRLI